MKKYEKKNNRHNINKNIKNDNNSMRFWERNESDNLSQTTGPSEIQQKREKRERERERERAHLPNRELCRSGLPQVKTEKKAKR